MIIKKYSFTFVISALIIISIVFAVPSADAAKKRNAHVHKKQTRGTAVTKVSRQRLQPLSKNPYLGAIVIDADTSKVLFEDNADAKGYPASVVKMMNFLIILEAVEAKQITLQDKITVSAEVAKIGGSEVYLKEHEVYTVDDLLYALMVQSANDAAAALALHLSDSKDEFVNLMNKRARELGMKDTVFRTVNGFPPGKGLMPDVSTPRDITKLSQEVLKHPSALQYTSTKERLFRAGAQPFIIRNHNHLVRNFEGCDGLKTGYFRAAGFSIAATATKNGKRAIAVIFGSVDRRVRDAKARKLLSESLMEIASNLPAPGVSVAQGDTAFMNEQMQN
ncbi:MAG: D-alanyl-D-alanine carboxypeptidase [Nitrospirae bacterium]|nr:D-alanyl-D-alanine carboxypeptidase [Nitrospirota bacterium]